jgi:CheY-like chemotaxis protein
LAEDNPTNQLVAQMMLGHLGHSIQIAPNGQEALECLRRESYDLVLMDCQMPVMDGYEATRKIRAGTVSSELANIPIIAVTAYALPSDRQRALEVGMNDHISKPLTAEALQAAFENLGIVGSAIPETDKSTVLAPPAHAVATSRFDAKQREQLRSIPTPEGASLWVKALTVFRTEMPVRIQALDLYLKEKRATELCALAHTIAGSAANVGATDLRHVAQALEKFAKSGTWNEIPGAVDAVRNEWALIDLEFGNTDILT